MSRRPLRTDISLKRYCLVCAVVPTILFEAGCVGSADPRHDFMREAPTGLVDDEGVSVVLDTASLLAAERPATLKDEAAPVRLPGFGYSRQEDRLADCVFDALEDTRPSVRTVPPRQLWKAAYPDVEPEALPRDEVSWVELAADPVFKDRIGGLGLRYVVVVGVEETLDSTDGYAGGDAACSGGSHPACIAGGYLGRSRTTSLRMKATVVDLANARRAGTISSTSTGTHKSTLVFGVFIIIPVAFPVFTGDTPTHGATCKELGEAVAKFLAADLDLYAAAEAGNVTEVDRLIADGADVNAKGDNGETALQLASAKGQLAVVELLIANDADVNTRDKREQSALDAAVSAGHHPVAELLIINGASGGLHVASANGYIVAVEQLLKEGAEADVDDGEGATPLHRAAMSGHMEIAQLLISHGANVNARDGNSATPLEKAVSGGHREMADLLIAQGADVEVIADEPDELLHAAVSSEHTEIAELLILHGADPNAEDEQGNRPLPEAARSGNTELVRALIDQGAHVDAKGADGKTALHVAVEDGKTALAELLIIRGADANAKVYDGGTLLHEAVANGNEEMARLLVAHRVDINARDHMGSTALHDAVNAKRAGMVELLSEEGADLVAENDDGHTPLDLAVSESDQEIIQVLMSHLTPVQREQALQRLPTAADKLLALAALQKGGLVGDGEYARKRELFLDEQRQEEKHREEQRLAIAAASISGNVGAASVEPGRHLAVAIFPFGGHAPSDSTNGEVVSRTAEAAKRAVGEIDGIDLLYSYYDPSAGNSLQIAEPENVWRQANPFKSLNESATFSHGRMYELDAVVIFDLKIPVGGSDWDPIKFDIEYMVFDVRTKKVIKRTGDVGQAESITRQLLSKLVSTPASTPVKPKLRVAVFPFATGPKPGYIAEGELTGYTHQFVNRRGDMELVYSAYDDDFDSSAVGDARSLWTGGFVSKSPNEPNVYRAAAALDADLVWMYYFNKRTGGHYADDLYVFDLYLLDVRQKHIYRGSGDDRSVREALELLFQRIETGRTAS